jgi:quinol monooxygenase YgiN
MDPTVAVFGTLRFPPDRMAEVLPHLKSLVETTYRSDGCIAYDVALDPFDPGLIRFSELWPHKESLACTMHEGTDFHGHACKFGDVGA